MKRSFLFILFLAAMLGLFTSAGALTVQIGPDGATPTTSYFPIYGLYGYNYSQQIYFPSEIGYAAPITKIRFWYVSGTITNSKDWVIYMGHTTQSDFSTTTSWIPLTSLTQVFAGDVSSIMTGSAGWKEITLTTAFNYNNTDNLVIAVDENTSGYASMSWGGYTPGTTYRGIEYYNDSTNPNPSSPPTANYRGTTIDRIQLEMTVVGYPGVPTNPSPANNATNVAQSGTLTWDFGADTTTYSLYFGTPGNMTLVDSGNATGPSGSWNYGPLSALTTYNWQVKAHNSNRFTTNGPIWSFETTLGPGYSLIGSGTSTQRQPFGIFFGYERSAAIYTQAQIGSWGLLDIVGWKCSTTSTSAVPYKIYVKTTTETGFTASTWADFVATATLVKTGTYTFSSTGWVQFTLDTPFTYASGNLIVAVETYYGGSGTSPYPYFYYSTGATNSHQYWYADSTPPTSTGSLNTQLPNFLLHLGALPENPVLSVSPTSWDFGTVIINTPHTNQFTITNTGGGTLTVSGIAPASSGYFSLIDLPDFPVSLTTGQNTTFKIKYQPTATGPHSATFTISDNRSTTDVQVSGTCYDPTIYSFPWTENFGSTGATFPPLDWTRLTGLYPTETPTSTTSGWYQDDFGNVVTTPPDYSGRLNIWSTSTKYWLVTPPIAIPASGYELKFDMALTTYSGTVSPTPGNQADDKFIILISEDPMMTTPTVLMEWNNTGSPNVYDTISPTGENHIINLDAYPGTRYIAFYGESTVSGGDNNVYVDNITVREHPAGAPNNVTLLNPADGSTGADPASVVVSWQPADSGGTPTSYYVYVSTSEESFFDNQMGYEEVAAPTTSLDIATITGVTFECLTTYYWAVQAHNAAGDSDPEDPSFMVWSFTTKQQLSAPTTLALGSVWPESVETGTIPVTNNGPGEMTFTAAGPEEFEFGATRFSVPAYSTWNLPYTFTVPATTGPYSGTITLTETDPGSSTVDIAVTATITDQVVVGTGTTDLDLPVNVFYGYTYSQTIYYPTEINYPEGYRIEKLYYYFNGYETCESTKDWVIWMGHTTDTTFGSTTGWIPVTSLTQVYAGENIPQLQTGGYWMEFTLDTPFIYNGTDNLVIAVDENTPSYDSGSAYFYCTSATGYRSLRYYSDSTNPDPAAPPAGTQIAGLPNTKLYVAPIPTVPAISVTPESKDFGTVIINTPHTQQFQIMNFGGGDLTISSITYDGDTYYQLQNLPAVFPVHLLAGQTATFDVQYLPTAVGPHSGTVTITDNRGITTVAVSGVCADPRIATLPHSENFDGVTAPAFPLGWTAYKSYSSSTIYTSTSAAQSTPNSVYMYANTTTETMRLISPQVLVPMNSFKVSFYLRAGSTGSTLKVGTVSALDGTGVFTELATIAPATTGVFTQYTVSFLNYTGTDQYICFQHGTTSTYQSFYLDNVLIEELMSADLAATAIAGPAYGLAGSPMTFSITVYNNGTVQQTSYNVHLKRYGDDRLASVAVTTPLDPGAYATHNVTWTPGVPDIGNLSLVGEVELALDGNAANNETAVKAVSVFPSTAYVPLIGDPLSTTTANTLPLDFYWKNSLSETIYTALEMQMTAGTVSGVFYFNNFTQDLASKPVKIWAKNTTATDASSGWLPFEDYTLVFDGTVSFPIGVNTVYIPFTTPIAYTGGNFALRVNRPIDTQYYNSSNKFYYTVPQHDPNRSRFMYSDSETFDPTNPGSASTTPTVNSNIPITAFMVANAVPVVLAAPVVTISQVGGVGSLTWDAVPGAYAYRIYASDDPYTWDPEADPLAVVWTNSYTPDLTAPKMFYKVVAVSTYRNTNGLTDNPATHNQGARIKAEPAIGRTDNKD